MLGKRGEITRRHESFFGDERDLLPPPLVRERLGVKGLRLSETRKRDEGLRAPACFGNTKKLVRFQSSRLKQYGERLVVQRKHVALIRRKRWFDSAPSDIWSFFRRNKK